MSPAVHAALWLIPRGLLAVLGVCALRTAWIMVARRRGLANPTHFRFWLVIPWRFAAIRFIRMIEWFEQSYFMGRKATAGWAGYLQRACLVYRPGRVLYGRQHFAGLGLLQPVGEDCERHLAMIAGTGSGKTTQLITMLSLHPGNALIIDPKAQVYHALRERLSAGGGGVIGKPPVRSAERTVAALDPEGLTGYPSQCWNAIDEIGHAIERHGEGAAVRFATRMADGLVRNSPGTNEFFPGNARGFCQALLLYVHTYEPPERRHMVRFRELLTVGLPPVDPITQPFDMLLFEMSRCKAFGGVIERAASTILGASDRARGDILATAREQTKWLDLPEIAAISERSDFQLADLKRADLSLFICASATDIRTSLSPWFRLIAMTALYVFECIPGRLEHSCFFAVDEMPSLGPIEGLDTIAPLMRSYA